MNRLALLRTWAYLAALTVIGTALHFSAIPAQIAGVLILLTAGLKARLILLDYLELRGVAGWASGLVSAIAALLVLLAVFFLAADGVSPLA